MDVKTSTYQVTLNILSSHFNYQSFVLYETEENFITIYIILILGVSGLTFRKDLYLASSQIYPVQEENKKPLTRLQERLMKKLGEHAFPFYFELPPHCPASVTLQPAPGDTGKPCGIDYEMKAFVGDAADDKPHKR